MYQKAFSLTGIAVVALVLTLLGVQPLPIHAQESSVDSFVYVMSNKSPDNSILQFRRATNGSLTFVREVRTGGSGTGPTVVDPLGSQDSLVLTSEGQLLFAVNAGSN